MSDFNQFFYNIEYRNMAFKIKNLEDWNKGFEALPGPTACTLNVKDDGCSQGLHPAITVSREKLGDPETHEKLAIFECFGNWAYNICEFGWLEIPDVETIKSRKYVTKAIEPIDAVGNNWNRIVELVEEFLAYKI